MYMSKFKPQLGFWRTQRFYFLAATNFDIKVSEKLRHKGHNFSASQQVHKIHNKLQFENVKTNFLKSKTNDTMR